MALSASPSSSFISGGEIGGEATAKEEEGPSKGEYGGGESQQKEEDGLPGGEEERDLSGLPPAAEEAPEQSDLAGEYPGEEDVGDAHAGGDRSGDCHRLHPGLSEAQGTSGNAAAVVKGCAVSCCALISSWMRRYSSNSCCTAW